MPPKDVVFSEEAREKLRKGVDTIASVVGSTLGPKGRNVMIAKYSTPEVSNDGQNIAKQFEALEDIHEDVGMRIVKEAAVKTGDKVGDGTTSSVVLGSGHRPGGPQEHCRGRESDVPQARRRPCGSGRRQVDARNLASRRERRRHSPRGHHRGQRP